MTFYLIVLLLTSYFGFGFFVDELSDRVKFSKGLKEIKLKVVMIFILLLSILLFSLGLINGFKEIVFFLVIPFSFSLACLKVGYSSKPN
jgi:hypothetical protein